MKRLVYNKQTGQLSGFLPTSLSGEFIDSKMNIYCEVNGDEENIDQISEVKSLLIKYQYDNINKNTEDLITSGIVYQGVRFWTDDKAQQNYTALYVKRNDPEVQYPYTIWDGTGSVSLSDSSQMEDFCDKVMEHVQTQRVTGKQIRSTLETLTEVELLNFVDPRL